MGVLIVVLIVTHVNVSSAAKRIRANLPEVTVPMTEELREREQVVQKRLAGLRSPPRSSPGRWQARRSSCRRSSCVSRMRRARPVQEADLELAVIEQDVEQLQEKLEAEEESLRIAARWKRGRMS